MLATTRWLSSGFAPARAEKVDAERGIIYGMSVVTAGEAKGHGVNLDREFIARTVELGNAKRQGVKTRFGHPNMCSTALGTFLGRTKNFRESPDGNRALADLYLSNEAKATPHGDLFAYVVGMAKNEPDMFGASIVFTPGDTYKRDANGAKIFSDAPDFDRVDGPEFVEIDELRAADTVDDPAANDGLFSRFSKETLAGQMTEFLDLHPQIWDAVRENSDLFESLVPYADRLSEFFNRYNEYKQQKGEAMKKAKKTAGAEPAAAQDPELFEGEDAPAADAPAPESPAPEAPKAPEADAPPAEPEPEAPAAPAEDSPKPDAPAPEADAPAAPAEGKPQDADPESETAPEPTPEPEPEAPALRKFAVDELKALAKEFGPEIAVATVVSGGSRVDALAAQNAELKAQNAELTKKAGKAAGVAPVMATPADKSKKGATILDIVKGE